MTGEEIRVAVLLKAKGKSQFCAMSNDKQQVAAAIKRLVAELQTELDKAQQAGLIVKLTPPCAYSLAEKAGELQVEVWEKISY